MGKDRAIFDASSSDCHRVFKFFVANFRVFFEMEDYINLAKPFNRKNYWIAAKRPKAMATLCRSFPQEEWDVLTTTINSQIAEEDKHNPAQCLTKLSQLYLGREPFLDSILIQL